VRLHLTPASDPVSQGANAGLTVWSATTEDPVFIARPANGGQLKPGWHRASIELQARAGEVVEPRIYLPDTEGRFAEARSIAMTRSDGAWIADFQLHHVVDHVRFDPSRAPCVFACDSLRVERTRKAEPLVSGLRSVARQAATAVGLRPGATGRMRREWERDGYLVLPKFYSDAELDSAQRALDRAWASKEPRIVVDDLVTHERLRLSDVTEEARRKHRFKVNDLYLEHEEVRSLALNARLTPIIRDLLGHPPVICNSLSFQQGSAQPDHVDALYMTPISHGQLVATWVAVEDCDLKAGPLRYFPGSHKIPPYVFSNGTNRFIPEEMGLWRAYMDEQVKKLGLEPEVFPARRGDVFVWSAYLLHGGSPIADPNLTRKSIVFHYFSEGDCRGVNFTLVPYAGGFWLHRRHPAIPGQGESEAPPLPAPA
jgi:phytanoyl-CoA hydroxylase